MEEGCYLHPRPSGQPPQRITLNPTKVSITKSLWVSGDTLPNSIPTAYVISASGTTIDNRDGQNVHFDVASYTTLGKRYAQQMLKLLKVSSVHPSERSAEFAPGDFVVYDAKGVRMGGFNAADLTSLEVGWAGASKSLPNGIYWVRNVTTGYAQKVIKGI